MAVLSMHKSYAQEQWVQAEIDFHINSECNASYTS